MKRSGRNKSALIVAAVLGAGAMLAAAGCSSKKGGEIRAEGETTIISSPTKTAAEYTPEENAYVLAGKLKSLTSYRTEVSGEVSAGFGPIIISRRFRIPISKTEKNPFCRQNPLLRW